MLGFDARAARYVWTVIDGDRAVRFLRNPQDPLHLPLSGLLRVHGLSGGARSCASYAQAVLEHRRDGDHFCVYPGASRLSESS